MVLRGAIYDRVRMIVHKGKFMSEILAPAGDVAAFYAALDSGADAIYLGMKNFSARRSAANFSAEELHTCIERAHVLGVKVYVALNTLVKDSEVGVFFAAALEAWNAGADALIIQDIFLGRLLKRTYPEMILHLSTQAGVCNVYGARLAKRYGFSRVILARETPLEDIRAIAAEIETEVFVQGALCTCFSGQCYMSSFAGGNSGNRGLCKQPCRKKYSVDRKGFEKYAYALSLSDLCVGEDIGKLAKAGVSSFKIEGRMRSAAYVGAAVRYYKDILSGAEEDDLKADVSDLKRAYNRGDYTRGYVFRQDHTLLSRWLQGHKGETVGRVSSRQRYEKFTFFESLYTPSDGDGFKVIRAEKEEIGGGVYRSGYPKGEGGFYLPKNVAYRAGDEICLTSDISLAARVAARKRLLPVSVCVRVAVGEPPAVQFCGHFGEFALQASFCAEQAKSRALSPPDIAECFSKTDGYPFALTFASVETDGQSFVVRSALNFFRRQAFTALFEMLSTPRLPLAERAICVDPKDTCVPKEEVKSDRLAVIDRDFSTEIYRHACLTDAVFKPTDYKNLNDIKHFLKVAEYYAWHKWLYLPAFMLASDLNGIRDYVHLFDGVYAEGTFALEYCREKGIPLFAGCGFNLFNSTSVALLEEELPADFTLSKELSAAESAAMRAIRKDGFVLAGGGIKVMELGHCIFGKTCSSCDRRAAYRMQDEEGRCFPLLRGENSACRFEVYNPAFLVSDLAGNRLYDFCPLSKEEKEAYLSGRAGAMLGNRTSGALKRGTN